MIQRLKTTTNRSYTGHEYIEETDVIHMNARVYDTITSRFTSADSYIQAPNNTQSYNRYSYVMNNPVNYIDPSGYWSIWESYKNAKHWGQDHRQDIKQGVAIIAAVVTTAATAGGAGPGWAGFFTAVASGAAGGAVSGAIMSGTLKGAAEGAVWGGITGGVAFGVAEVTGALSGVNAHGATFINGGGKSAFIKAVAHGLSRTAISELRYGTTKGAFMSGFISSGFSVGSDAGVEGAFVMAIVGGSISELGGGKFANGALSSAFQYLLNDMIDDAVKYSSRIIGGVGGALQVTAGGVLIYTGAGAPLGTLMIMQGANNIQEAITGVDGYLRGSYDFWFGNNSDIAYATVDIGSSLTGLMRQVGLKSTTIWTKNFGNVEYVRPMYGYETMNKGSLLFETANNMNTIYSNKGN